MLNNAARLQAMREAAHHLCRHQACNILSTSNSYHLNVPDSLCWGRFSISWPRIFPEGTTDKENPAGINVLRLTHLPDVVHVCGACLLGIDERRLDLSGNRMVYIPNPDAAWRPTMMMQTSPLKNHSRKFSLHFIITHLCSSTSPSSGVEFYRKLLGLLNDSGIKPLATLYHWDLPSALAAKGGWLSNDSPEWFEAYARRCFDLFDDAVHSWITFNEPWCICALGYCVGSQAPGRKSRPGTEPYIAAHNVLLGHARAYRQVPQPHASAPYIIALPHETSAVPMCQPYMATRSDWCMRRRGLRVRVDDTNAVASSHPCQMQR